MSEHPPISLDVTLDLIDETYYIVLKVKTADLVLVSDQSFHMARY